MKFVWNSKKAAANLKWHRVSFAEAREAFYDLHAVVEPDDEHSWDEQRYMSGGNIMKSKNGKNAQKTKEVIIDVTEEDYQQGLAKGIREEALLKPGRHRFVRGANPLIRAGLLPATAPKKVRISILIDEDILRHFKQRAATPNALPYQTQINNTLRAAMMDDLGVTVEIENDPESLLTDPAFVEAVARIVKEQLAQEQKQQRKRA